MGVTDDLFVKADTPAKHYVEYYPQGALNQRGPHTSLPRGLRPAGFDATGPLLGTEENEVQSSLGTQGGCFQDPWDNKTRGCSRLS